VRALLETGATGAAIARELGISKSAVSYHKRRLGYEIDTRCNRRYDWKAVQAFYDAGHSITECQERFGFARKTFVEPLRGAPSRLGPSARRSSSISSAGGTRTGRISRGSSSHHGDGLDNRLENLRLLCPNCHAQTENFSGRGRKRLGVA
jgi:biotin operon repressor